MCLKINTLMHKWLLWFRRRRHALTRPFIAPGSWGHEPPLRILVQRSIPIRLHWDELLCLNSEWSDPACHHISWHLILRDVFDYYTCHSQNLLRHSPHSSSRNSTGNWLTVLGDGRVPTLPQVEVCETATVVPRKGRVLPPVDGGANVRPSDVNHGSPLDLPREGCRGEKPK